MAMQVNVCFVKTMTRGSGGCYADMMLRDGETAALVGEATHFVSHAWCNIQSSNPLLGCARILKALISKI